MGVCLCVCVCVRVHMCGCVYVYMCICVGVCMNKHFAFNTTLIVSLRRELLNDAVKCKQRIKAMKGGKKVL